MKRGKVIETSSTSSSLQEQVDRLQRELNDREIALVTSNERGDFLEAQLYRLNTGLAAEIRERPDGRGEAAAACAGNLATRRETWRRWWKF